MFDFLVGNPFLILGIVSCLLVLSFYFLMQNKHILSGVSFSLTVMMYFGWHNINDVSSFPVDLVWYAGVVQEHKTNHHGEIDILFTDGTWIVSTSHPIPKDGEVRYLLNASTKSGKLKRTFDCLDRRRETCHNLSLLINSQFDGYTMNQGLVVRNNPNKITWD